jgi:hypothetical protein
MKKIILALCVVFISCDRIPEGYSKFQTFDEYCLKGVVGNKVVSPFVSIKKTKDTISIFVNNRFIQYINLGDYWYNLTKKQESYSPECKCDTTPYYIEKFIYNDTIMQYEYFLKRGRMRAETLKFITRNNIIILSDSAGFIANKGNKFKQLKKYAINFRFSFEVCYKSDSYQRKFYSYYRKIQKGDSLLLYENIGNKLFKFGSLVSAKKLNSLGEFGLNGL